MIGQLKMEPYDIMKLKNIPRRKSGKYTIQNDNIFFIEKFVESDYDCCKVFTGSDNRKAHIECTILRRSVNAIGANVRVVLRGNNVFLVRKNVWDEQVKKKEIEYEY